MRHDLIMVHYITESIPQVPSTSRDINELLQGSSQNQPPTVFRKVGEMLDPPSSPLWNKALERYKAELEDDHVYEYQTILEEATLEDLIEQIKTLQPPNAREKAVVNRLDSILRFINDFPAMVAVSLGTE
ncbi:MAG: hypothetical protein Q9216_004712, partial [Gyalolechia sp. 2 TL-2023]